MKDISFRPTNLILSLFEQIRNLDHLPNTDRNSITRRAMVFALKNKNIDWQFVSAMTTEEGFTGSIPKHIVLKVDEEQFNLINDQIKNAFNKEKITIPYTMKLLLVNYLTSFSQTNSTDVRESIHPEINLALFKSEYVQSLYSNKKRLLETCKVYLKLHVELQQNLTEHVTLQNKHLNHIYDLSSYFPDLRNTARDNFVPGQRTEFGTPTATYLAKILAGWFIFMVESQYETIVWNDVLDSIIKRLEGEFQIKNESPFEKTRTKKDEETADYYKNVYARMMSR